MTESEWLSCTRPDKMLFFLRDQLGERDMRRFMAACCRRVWPYIVDERGRRAVEAAELDALGQLSSDGLEAAAKAAAEGVADAFADLDITKKRNGHHYHAACAAALTARSPRVPLSTPDTQVCSTLEVAVAVAIHCPNAVSVHAEQENPGTLRPASRTEHAGQCDLIRELFDNPFGTSP